MIALLAIFGAQAQTSDSPHLFSRGLVAVTVNPSGVLADGVMEARAPVLRRPDSLLFNMTFVGAGLRAAVTPVHAEIAGRVSFQFIDVLPVTVEAFYGNFWKSPWGFIPMPTVAGQRLPDRAPFYEAERDFAATQLGVTLSPTFQIAAGPFVAFSNVNITWLTVNAPENPEPYIFEPYRGLAITPQERVIDHTSAVMVQLMDGKDKSLLRIGGATRGKAAKNSGDVTLTAGLVAQYRPGRTERGVNFLLLAAPYLRDPDFAGIAPNVLLAISFSRVTPFKSP